MIKLTLVETECYPVFLTSRAMKVATVAILLSAVAVFACATDASLTTTNGCCQAREMAEGKSCCDCCRLAALEFPCVVAVESVSFEPPALVVTLPLPLELLTDVRVSRPFVDSGEPVRDHSPPKRYILLATLLI